MSARIDISVRDRQLTKLLRVVKRSRVRQMTKCPAAVVASLQCVTVAVVGLVGSHELKTRRTLRDPFGERGRVWMLIIAMLVLLLLMMMMRRQVALLMLLMRCC